MHERSEAVRLVERLTWQAGITACSAVLPVGTQCRLYDVPELQGRVFRITGPFGPYDVKRLGFRLGYLIDYDGHHRFVPAGKVVAIDAPKHYSHLRLMQAGSRVSRREE